MRSLVHINKAQECLTISEFEYTTKKQISGIYTIGEKDYFGQKFFSMVHNFERNMRIMNTLSPKYSVRS